MLLTVVAMARACVSSVVEADVALLRTLKTCLLHMALRLPTLLETM